MFLRAFRFLLPVLVLFTAHYAAANLYAAICAPLSLKGLLLSFFATSSPVCNALLGALNFTSNNYTLIMGGLLASGIGALTMLLPAAGSAAEEQCRPVTRRQHREAGAGPTPA
jgi:hypothetical protein